MKLMTKANVKSLPPLYSQENVKDPMVKVKFFTPDSNWTWYATEFDGKDTFFGYVVGHDKELGYFSLKELQTNRGPMGLHIERDKWFTPTRLSVVKAKEPNPGKAYHLSRIRELKKYPQIHYNKNKAMLEGAGLEEVISAFKSGASRDEVTRARTLTNPTKKKTSKKSDTGILLAMIVLTGVAIWGISRYQMKEGE